MKAQKKLNIVLIVLLIILISIVSFVGIFYQNKNKMIDSIPEYTLGTDLIGYRKVILTLDDEAEENTDELKNYDNFIKSASIIKKRLASMEVTDYSVRCDESTGQIEITIPENMQTDYILADITQKGKFEIVDSSNNEVLMNNDDIRSTKVVIQKSSYENSSSVYMNINFNSAGSKKFKNITQNYQNVISNEVVSNTLDENNVSENETTESKEETRQVSLNIDGTSMMQTTFSEVIDNGVLGLTLGNGSSSNDLKILEYQAKSLAAILENDEIPLKYTVTGNVYISSPIEENSIKTIIYLAIAIAMIIFVITIIKYKSKGLIISISEIGFIALYLLILRYANVVISLEGMFAIGIIFIINHLFNIIFLNKLKKNVEKAFTKSLTKFSFAMIPVLIFSVVCCFSSWMSIFSLGMVLFWGLIISVIYNLIITKFVIY